MRRLRYLVFVLADLLLISAVVAGIASAALAAAALSAMDANESDSTSSGIITPPPPWHNSEGGPLVNDPVSTLLAQRHLVMPAPPPPNVFEPALLSAPPFAVIAGAFNYSLSLGYLEALDADLGSIGAVPSLEAAASHCSALPECRGFTYKKGNGSTCTSYGRRRGRSGEGCCWPARVHFRGLARRNSSATEWASWYKMALVKPPAATFNNVGGSGLNLALRAGTYTVQWLNASACSAGAGCAGGSPPPCGTAAAAAATAAGCHGPHGRQPLWQKWRLPSLLWRPP